MTPKTTIFCAVYSQDPMRWALLDQHLKNTAAQSVKVKRVYVFDSADTPSALPADCDYLVSGQPLTIYEAWNLAITLCRTPYLMNLNLDDRLRTDAVALMEREIEASSADLVAGDWKVCYSQEDTDQVGAAEPTSAMPFVRGWPPKEGSHTRLGSGTGERLTYGPATLWRAELHSLFARYPYRTADGMYIRSVADQIWWMLLARKQKKLHRIPFIIGNYHSHPDTQAEFRVDDEMKNLMGKQVILY